MNWYYAENGQQTGPVNDEQLNELVHGGRIKGDTLVWCEGMTAWAPYLQTRSGTGSGNLDAAGADAMPEAVCAECGRIFPMDETIRYGDVRICAACKPVFLQKLQEGAPVSTGQLNYARVLTRFAAQILDALRPSAWPTRKKPRTTASPVSKPPSRRS